MNLKIQKITEKNYQDTYRILGNSYPDLKIPQDKAFEWFNKILEDSENRDFWGGFIDNEQVSTFVTNNFTMNFRGQMIPAGGIGMVAVELLHKKEKICKQMIEFYEQYYSKKDTSMLVLYPFRPDFYNKMDFGMGSTLHAYAIEPRYFPKYEKSSKLEYAKLVNLSEITDFYNHLVKDQHGAMLRQEREFEGWLKSSNMRCLLYRDKDEIQGYMFFGFAERLPKDKGSFDLKIKEMQFKSVDVWRQFSTFLNSQIDQVKRVQFTTFDKDFYHYFSNTVNESKDFYHIIYQNISFEKTALMYKISDPLKFFENLNPNIFNQEDITIKFVIQNELFPKNKKIMLTYNFAKSKIVNNEENIDLTLKMNLARFTSILMGSLSFSSAVRYGLVEIDNIKYIDCVDKLFRSKNMPVGYNEF